jgi:hypothetical protein
MMTLRVEEEKAFSLNYWFIMKGFFLFACKISISNSVYMKLRLLTLLFYFLFQLGCSDNGNSSLRTPKDGPEEVEDSSKRKTLLPVNEDAIVTSDRNLEEIMSDFRSPIDAYPFIDQKEAIVRKNGRTYRRGLENEPFSGTVVQTFPDGSLSLSTTFYEGRPHGFQKRNFPNGTLASEVIFDKGVLSGVKTKWWDNGAVREEEYWSGGKYKGRRLWDTEGRMTREELVQDF